MQAIFGALRHVVLAARFAAALCGLIFACSAPAAAQMDLVIVRGSVADAAGRSLGDFPVLVADSAGRSVPVRTGRDGRFATIGLAPGLVTIRLDAQGFEALGVRCRIRSGETAIIELFAARTAATQPPAARCRIETPTSDRYIIE